MRVMQNPDFVEVGVFVGIERLDRANQSGHRFMT